MKKYIQSLLLLSALLLSAITTKAQISFDFEIQQVPDGVLIEWGRTGGFGLGDSFGVTRKALTTQVEVELVTIPSGGPSVEEYSYTDVGPFEPGVNYLFTVIWISPGTDSIYVGEALVYLEDPEFVSGTVAIDTDGACDYDAGENVFPGSIITATSSGNTIYTTTNLAGEYFLALPQFETYEVSVTSPSSYLQPCNGTETIMTSPGAMTTLDFPLTPIVDCPYLVVDLGVVALVRCFDSNYSVSYCNYGSETAEDAFLEIDFDDFLLVNSSSLPWSSVSGNTYTFELGDVEPGECGAFSVNVTTSCDAELGQTHCSVAHIYPDSICTPSVGWDESSLFLTGECDGGEVVFTVTNVGTQPMSEALEYLVVEDNVMLMDGTLGPLGVGESEQFAWSSEGATFRMEVEQSQNHPGESNPSLSIEGCGGPPVSLGFVVIFPEDDADPFVSIDCRENVGSFDPNDKQAFPRGYGGEHFIEQNQDIEYLIRFQNTGTAPAFNVRIEDAIDQNLDLFSLRPSASSHPYEFQLADDGTVNFLFENINLPDSTSNEPESHGFVKFRIHQQPDVSIGTVITNEAAIYFDFNEPIITNEVFHTIGEDFITVVSSVNTTLENVEVNVFPNPFFQTATVQVDGLEGQQLTFRMFDLTGKIISEYGFESQMHIDGSDLSSGVYFFEISNEHTVFSTGKIVR